MIKNNRFLWLMLILMFLLVAVQLWGPRPINWTPTLSHSDKIPYGTYILQEELLHRFDLSKPVINETLYEICNETEIPEIILSLSESFYADSLDAVSLLSFVDAGGRAFISAADFYGPLADTLNLSIDGNWRGSLNLEAVTGADSTAVHFVNTHLQPQQSYLYRDPAIYTYFSSVDTLRTQVIAVNGENYPVMIQVSWGSGLLFLSTTPFAFTNYYILKKPNHQYVSKALSYLLPGTMVRTEYYQLGRQEMTTPLRFIVRDPALKWTYYLALISLLLFVFFEAKRKQKVIPVIKPLQNTTLDFTQTVSRLYFEQRDHRNIAQKMISYFLEDIRTNFYLPTNNLDEAFYLQLSKKTQRNVSAIKSLFKKIEHVLNSSSISEQQLIDLSQQINLFQKSTRIK